MREIIVPCNDPFPSYKNREMTSLQKAIYTRFTCIRKDKNIDDKEVENAFKKILNQYLNKSNFEDNIDFVLWTFYTVSPYYKSNKYFKNFMNRCEMLNYDIEFIFSRWKESGFDTKELISKLEEVGYDTNGWGTSITDSHDINNEPRIENSGCPENNSSAILTNIENQSISEIMASIGNIGDETQRKEYINSTLEGIYRNLTQLDEKKNDENVETEDNNELIKKIKNKLKALLRGFYSEGFITGCEYGEYLAEYGLCKNNLQVNKKRYDKYLNLIEFLKNNGLDEIQFICKR